MKTAARYTTSEAGPAARPSQPAEEAHIRGVFPTLPEEVVHLINRHKHWSLFLNDLTERGLIGKGRGTSQLNQIGYHGSIRSAAHLAFAIAGELGKPVEEIFPPAQFQYPQKLLKQIEAKKAAVEVAERKKNPPPNDAATHAKADIRNLRRLYGMLPDDALRLIDGYGGGPPGERDPKASALAFLQAMTEAGFISNLRLPYQLQTLGNGSLVEAARLAVTIAHKLGKPLEDLFPRGKFRYPKEASVVRKALQFVKDIAEGKEIHAPAPAPPPSRGYEDFMAIVARYNGDAKALIALLPKTVPITEEQMQAMLDGHFRSIHGTELTPQAIAAHQLINHERNRIEHHPLMVRPQSSDYALSIEETNRAMKDGCARKLAALARAARKPAP